jgi:hypothetical protein
MSRQGQSGGQSFLISAIVGGVVGFVILALFNLLPIIGFLLGLFGIGVGGAVAGGLYRGETIDGLKAGAAAGVVTAIPATLLVGLIVVLFGGVAGLSAIGAAAEAGSGSSAAGGVLGTVLFFGFGAVVMLIGTGINAVIGAIGGVVGVSLAD